MPVATKKATLSKTPSKTATSSKTPSKTTAAKKETSLSDAIDDAALALLPLDTATPIGGEALTDLSFLNDLNGSREILLAQQLAVVQKQY